MDYELMFPGRFMKAVEFKGRDMTAEIEAIETEMMPDEKAGEKLKGIVAFKGVKKKWVLNRTNAMCLAELFGRNTDGWIGHKVTLYPAPYEGDVCIRVKGTPELKEPLVFELKLPRKKARTVRLLPTGKGAKKEEAPPAEEPAAAEDSFPEAEAT